MRSQVVSMMVAPEGSGYLRRDPVAVHVMGDLHFTTTLSTSFIPARMEAFKDDVLVMPVPDYRVSIGDITQDGGSNQKAMAQAMFAEMETGTGIPVMAVAGNHDYWGSNDGDTFTADFNAPCWYEDVGDWLRLIGVSPLQIRDPNPGYIDIDFLRDASDTDRVCVVFCHYPIIDTVKQSSDPTSKHSNDPFYHAYTVNAVNSALAARPQIKAWISGHTHSGLDAEDFFKAHPIQGRGTVVTVSTSALAHTPSRPIDVAMPLCSPVVRIFPTKMEVTFRNHKTGGVAQVGGKSTTILPFV